jgi:hypothetical protein
MVVRLLFICSLSPKLCCETVRARGATLENLLVYSCESVQYWCGGAALLAKLWSCGSTCAGFGKCAAWVGLSFGLNMSPVRYFNFLPVGISLICGNFNSQNVLILSTDAPTYFAGAGFNFVDALIYLMGVKFNFMEARIYFVGVIFNFTEDRFNFSGARIYFAEAPI